MYTPQRQAPQVFEGGIRMHLVTTVMRSPDDLYEAWRDLTDLPRFIDQLESVVILDDRRSHWTTRGPAGPVSWEAEITTDEPGRRIAWRSTSDSDIKTAGTVAFTPLATGRGTRVDVTLEYVPPLGKVGAGLGKATATDAKTQIRQALHRFRQVMETGEVAVRTGQPIGAGRDDGRDGDQTRDTDADVRDIARMGQA